MNNIDTIFDIQSNQEFNALTLEIFKHQHQNNAVYRRFCDLLNTDVNSVTTPEQIPFLPIEFFKSHDVTTGSFEPETTFLSSGTTGQTPSRHLVKDLELYRNSYTKGFEHFYGSVEDYCVLALLPSYLEREGSSLIYMIADFIAKSKNEKSGFFLKNEQKLINILQKTSKNEQKTLLFGVSFALLGLAEQHQLDLSNTIIMETGGMKGRREELTRQELHRIYREAFSVKHIHSEYGMTELLSQAYSQGNGLFETPPWMKIMIRDVNDPFAFLPTGKTGGLNVIDLANVHSCSFIATQDLGRKNEHEQFEVLGRFDNSDLRGCNLLIAE